VCGTGSRETELRALARGLAVDERVRFLGRREDVEQVMGASDVVCVPSVVDGFGRVAVEALSVGTPVLAHALDALPDVLGQLPGVGWVEATVTGWVQALTHAKTWQVTSAKLAEAAMTRYGLDRAVRAYTDLYEEAR
jgi:glycosyltransferase involved in cell wall biosynthesis